MHCSITHDQKQPGAQREQIDGNSEPKKPQSVPGFEPSLLGQNAVAQPLVPPPLPETLGEGPGHETEN